MASRNAQSHAKRARELAVREKRELKRAKKAAQRAGDTNDSSVDPGVPTDPHTTDEQAERTDADKEDHAFS